VKLEIDIVECSIMTFHGLAYQVMRNANNAGENIQKKGTRHYDESEI